jgi:hypothetical protein
LVLALTSQQHPWDHDQQDKDRDLSPTMGDSVFEILSMDWTSAADPHRFSISHADESYENCRRQKLCDSADCMRPELL